jgi:hypothetical protein
MKRCIEGNKEGKTGSGAALDDLEVGLDAHLQVGDGHVFPLKSPLDPFAGAVGLYFILGAPSANGAGVYVENISDLTGCQHRALRLPGRLSFPSAGIFHQFSPVTISGSGAFPNQ